MDSEADQNAQMAQRVKVGMTGLASVMLLIGVASAVFNWASKEPPAPMPGARADAANATMANMSDTGDVSKEPLAELGVTPSAATDVANKSRDAGQGR